MKRFKVYVATKSIETRIVDAETQEDAEVIALEGDTPLEEIEEIDKYVLRAVEETKDDL